MPTTSASGVRVSYRVAGSGPPIVLVHGYTSSAYTQFELTGWVAFLSRSRTVLTLDLRGHGRSEKPREVSRYSMALLGSDVRAAMDAAGIERADILGYSMGAMVAAELLLDHGERFDRAVLGGMGATWPADGERPCDSHGRGWPMLTPWSTGKGLVAWARHYDRRAMRALVKGTFAGRQPIDADRLAAVRQPVLSVVGARDGFCPGTRVLEERIPRCRRVVIPGRGHIGTVRDPRFKTAVATFLA